jgi:hypothetical protein
MDKSVLYKISYGLYAIGVMEGNIPQGCIVNTVFQITSDGVIAVSMNKNNPRTPYQKNGPVFRIHTHGGYSPKTIGRHGALYFRANDHKFEGLNYEMLDGLPLLKEGCAGYMLCTVVGTTTRVPTRVFAKVDDACSGRKRHVMTY